ncbi:unnamed protein product [Darwinula stevensoni]|uniref:Cytochrome P450 n=1 Tax=Darwinula stevensoni TaxID=69355 RepID=A0A7R9A8H8_9CRUS|nr:unnamed protein product [Darwinula stevensoni]CAG0896474.1 unnamed protein product [Darwinula stevensoni]
MNEINNRKPCSTVKGGRQPELGSENEISSLQQRRNRVAAPSFIVKVLADVITSSILCRPRAVCWLLRSRVETSLEATCVARLMMSAALVFASVVLVYLLHLFVKKLLLWSKLPPGILSSEGSLWQENRRFTMRVLRDFGFGKADALNSMIQDAALDLCQFLKENQHKPQDLGPRLNLAILNIIWKMTADKQFSHDDPKMQDFINKFNEVLIDSNVLGPFQWVPALIYFWPPAHRACQRIDRNMAAISQIYLEEVNVHKRNLSSFGSSKDYIDAYLTEMEQQKSRGEINPNFSEFQLRVNISDLFLAGSETTSNTIRWCVLFLLCHPEIQEKLQAEVDDVVGRDRLPSLNDRDRMPNTEAFIMEAQRLARLTPIGVGHAATDDIDFAGYRFPKGTVFLANLWSCHSDPKYWPDPEKFDPGRFLNPDGSLKTKVPSFLPFALGKRQCLGESLARMELFLILAIFMQKLTFRTTTGRPHPKAEPIDSFVINHPKPFEFLVEERKH